MNREERRATRKVLQLNAAADVPGDVCTLCAFIKVQVIGSRESLFKDPQGRPVELTMSQRIEPPYGLRWPYDLQRRPPCPECGGEGKITVINLEKKAKTISGCKACHGLGKQLKGDEFAPLCTTCAQYVYGWLKVRDQAHTEKYQTAGGRITLATAGDLRQLMTGQALGKAGNIGQIALPGMGPR